jgi:ankyrin repeat protein
LRRTLLRAAYIFAAVCGITLGLLIFSHSSEPQDTAAAPSPYLLPVTAASSMETTSRKLLTAAGDGDYSAVADIIKASEATGQLNLLMYETVAIRFQFHAEIDAKRIMALFLEHPADVNMKDPGNHNTILSTAAYAAPDFVESLVLAGAEVNTTDNQDSSPLLSLSGKGRPELIRLLLDHHADPNAVNSLGYTPLLGAMRPFAHSEFKEANRQTVKLLVEGGAKLDAQDDQGNTPLAIAAMYNQTELIAFMLEKGAGVNVKNAQGRTPLMEAVAAVEGAESEETILNAVKLLLEGGAQAGETDLEGHSAISMARERQLFKVEEALQAALKLRN